MPQNPVRAGFCVVGVCENKGMKHALRSVLALLTVTTLVAPFISSAASCPTLSRALARSAEGAEVRSLQLFLVDRGLLPSNYATGIFGLKTERAVQAFQSEQGLITNGTPATTGYGSVGARTRARIAAVCALGGQHPVSTSNPGAQPNPAPSSVNIILPTAVSVNVPALSQPTPSAPRIELGAITSDKVLVNFYGMPPQTLLFMTDPVSGKRIDMGGFSPLERGGNGYVYYPMLGEFAGQSYAFAAQGSTTKQGYATSSVFTVPKPPVGAIGAGEVGTLQILDGEVILYTFAGITRTNAESRCNTEKALVPTRNTRCTFNGASILF